MTTAVLQPNQTIVEDGLQGFALTIQQLHLESGALAAAPFQPDRFLVVRQKAVSINADADAPAAVSIAKVLKWGIPDQPIQHQRLLVLLICGRDGHDPGGIRRWLGFVQPLPEVQSPLNGSARGRDSLPPWVGGPGAESMTSRRQVIEVQPHVSIGELIDSDERTVIDLHDHMGADPQVRIPAHRPVLHRQDQFHDIAVDHTVIGGADQRQLRVPSGQLALELLNSSRWGHFLQTP